METNPGQLTIICISSYEKGHDFMRECRRLGCRVFLITSKSLENAGWPRESLDDIFFMQDENKQWKMNDLIYGVSYLARKINIDRIIALDDLDVEKAASLREHLRVPGMGETTVRYFRDKLAMRMKAKEDGIPVPEFIHVLNHQKIREFTTRVPPPWLIKPRSEAGAIGIKKIHNDQELWDLIDLLGDRQSFYLLEQFLPGEIYHADSIISEKNVVFCEVHKYGNPPMDVAHEGRVFTSYTLERNTEEEKELAELNQKIQRSMGNLRGVSHTEFLRSNESGKLYFLETSARVGGANIHELVKASSSINLWCEWAKIEISGGRKKYLLPPAEKNYAAIMLSLARQEHPDLSAYDDEEIHWKLDKPFHAGLIIRSESFSRVQELLNKYTARFYNDFFTTQPLPDKPV